jgi:hypothetical protein
MVSFAAGSCDDSGPCQRSLGRACSVCEASEIMSDEDRALQASLRPGSRVTLDESFVAVMVGAIPARTTDAGVCPCVCVRWSRCSCCSPESSSRGAHMRVCKLACV